MSTVRKHNEFSEFQCWFIYFKLSAVGKSLQTMDINLDMKIKQKRMAQSEKKNRYRDKKIRRYYYSGEIWNAIVAIFILIRWKWSKNNKTDLNFVVIFFSLSLFIHRLSHNNIGAEIEKPRKKTNGHVHYCFCTFAFNMVFLAFSNFDDGRLIKTN